MKTVRENIVDKLNSSSKFTLNDEEVKFILKNWLTVHSQHLASVDLVFDTDLGACAKVEIDKQSFYKHF